MSNHQLTNCVRQRRLDRRWSQDDLAARSGIARASISAIEVGRMVPSAASALALAAALQCRVEDLFQIADAPSPAPQWAWPPFGPGPHRYWIAEVNGRQLLFPAEATRGKASSHDGVALGSALSPRAETPPPTLVMASCDPAAELLAAEVARASGVRVLTFFHSSKSALALLRQNLVHIAGLHLGRPDDDGNASAVAAELGDGYSLVRAAQWEEGVVTSTANRVASLRALSRSKPRWVAREPGSGSRQCLDELLQGKLKPRRLAQDHVAVAEAVRGGWADAGVCPRLVAEESGLRFYSVRSAAFDLCFGSASASDPRIRALVGVLRSAAYRRRIADLPGYGAAATGESSAV